jgi:aspartate aminotransferase
MLKDLDQMPEESIVLLHVCSHNPTGVDPTQDQWHQIYDVMLKKRHMAFFDMAYQGFTSGDLMKDAYSLRYFARDE